MPTAPVSTSALLAEGPDVGEHRLSYEGFGYTYRIVRCDSPVTEPILILGGSDQTRYSWGRHERWLAPLGTLVTVDLPGFGDSDFLPSEYGVDFLAACTDHLLTELGLGKVNVFAGCYGAGIALRLAQNHPRHLRRLAVQGMAREMPPGRTSPDRGPRLTAYLQENNYESFHSAPCLESWRTQPAKPPGGASAGTYWSACRVRRRRWRWWRIAAADGDTLVHRGHRGQREFRAGYDGPADGDRKLQRWQ